MNPYQNLTEQDKELIENYITWFGPNNTYNMDWSNYAGLEHILSYWNKAKNESLFKMFGEELILHRPYTYKYNIEGLINEIIMAQKDKAYQDFMNWWSWGICHNANVKFEIIENNTDHYNIYYSKFFYIQQAYDTKALANNAYASGDFKIKFEDGSIFKISNGMKPMKILHKFVEKFGKPEDEEMFERFRIWHSQLLNQKTVDGELCLSIHPLDYMTMSDNANNWNSCMRWTDKYGHADAGDYRAGTIDCMNSPYIIVAYLHNPKHPFQLEKGEWEWNSKRWRELFIVNEGSITEIKGYPYQDENLTNTCLMWIKELAQKNLGWTYDDEEINMRESYVESDITYYFDFLKSDYMYKDIGTLKKHAGRINKKVLFEKFKDNSPIFRSEEGQKKNIFINIPYGGTATCMCCGAERHEENGEKSVMCWRCDSVQTCACCGAPIYNDDDCYWIDDNDEPYCYNCYSEETSMDDLSEESHLNDNMTDISLFLGYDKYERPIWYRGKTLSVYYPEDNWYYQKMFNSRPKYIDGIYSVTIAMINDGQYQACMNVFENPNDGELYPNELYYYPDMTLVNPDDRED